MAPPPNAPILQNKKWYHCAQKINQMNKQAFSSPSFIFPGITAVVRLRIVHSKCVLELFSSDISAYRAVHYLPTPLPLFYSLLLLRRRSGRILELSSQLSSTLSLAK